MKDLSKTSPDSNPPPKRRAPLLLGRRSNQDSKPWVAFETKQKSAYYNSTLSNVSNSRKICSSHSQSPPEERKYSRKKVAIKPNQGTLKKAFHPKNISHCILGMKHKKWSPRLTLEKRVSIPCCLSKKDFFSINIATIILRESWSLSLAAAPSAPPHMWIV